MRGTTLIPVRGRLVSFEVKLLACILQDWQNTERVVAVVVGGGGGRHLVPTFDAESKSAGSHLWVDGGGGFTFFFQVRK